MVDYYEIPITTFLFDSTYFYEAPKTVEVLDIMSNSIITHHLIPRDVNARLIIKIKEKNRLIHEICFGRSLNYFIYNEKIYLLNKKISDDIIQLLQQNGLTVLANGLKEFHRNL